MAIEPAAMEPLPSTQPAGDPLVEPSLGDLFRELAQESSTLIRQEMELAKVELRDNVRAFAKDAGKIAVGGALLFVAFLILNAFLIVLIGDALDNYWLGALILGVIYLIIGGVMAMSGKKGLQRDDFKPSETLRTLREDKIWAQSEAHEMKRELTS